MNTRAVYPGTYDPITNGHVDLLKRATKLFDHIVVGVAASPGKKPLFSQQERINLAKEVLADYKQIEVIGFDNLLIDFVKQQKASVILRGLRAVSDFEFEFQLAGMNRSMAKDIETIFLTPAVDAMFISSSLVKEIADLGGDVKQFVPEPVILALKKKINS